MRAKTKPRNDAMLTPKEARFVAVYLVELNTGDAADKSVQYEQL